jgi:hypothetical protein
MSKNYMSLENPGLLWGLIVALYAALSFIFIRSDATWLLGIPVVTWLLGGGGFLTVILCIILTPKLFKWENE